MENLINNTKKYREMLLADPYRPTYHFAIPQGNGRPGDSNGAFFADGRYHLMYLYLCQETNAFNWGHISSTDLLHWRNHPDAITGYKGDKGCFSGGAFVDDDGTAYISFWKFPSKDYESDNGGIAIAFSKPPYDKWERIEPIIEGSKEIWGTMDIEINGEIEHIGCADPSNIWKKDGWYYMQTGNLCVLNAYGREDDSPEKYKGDWTDLFKSKDMKTWTYVHRFYKNPHLGEDWPDKTEDDMCPSFLPLPDKKSGGKLTEKYLQLFIAHNKGCQYYIGELKDETFYPEQHGRMSWQDNSYFAPEALIDDKNRHIAWIWLLDNYEGHYEQYGWTSVFGFPRILWYENNILHMAPAEELDNLQYNSQQFDLQTVDGETAIAVKNGDSFRIKAEIDMKSASKAGFKVKINPEKPDEYVEIYFDKNSSQLIFNVSNHPVAMKNKETAPFSLSDGEKLSIDLFVDKSIIEVYANERQAICRRAYSKKPEISKGVSVFSDGADFGEISVFEMSPSNPY